jgi:hypothetical protein
MTNQTHFRYVTDRGETLVVCERLGCKSLADPTNMGVSVIVPSGRRAKLVNFRFGGNAGQRDVDVIVVRADGGMEFRAVSTLRRIRLSDLSQGQLVDVLPANDPCYFFAVVAPKLPVLYGAASVLPVYAYA